MEELDSEIIPNEYKEILTNYKEVMTHLYAYKSAVLSEAASIMVGHNHPSGNSEPSEADFNMTKGIRID